MRTILVFCLVALSVSALADGIPLSKALPNTAFMQIDPSTVAIKVKSGSKLNAALNQYSTWENMNLQQRLPDWGRGGKRNTFVAGELRSMNAVSEDEIRCIVAPLEPGAAHKRINYAETVKSGDIYHPSNNVVDLNFRLQSPSAIFLNDLDFYFDCKGNDASTGGVPSLSDVRLALHGVIEIQTLN